MQDVLQKTANDDLKHGLLQAQRICFRNEKDRFLKQEPISFTKQKYNLRINLNHL